jgi:hypothetical protein
MGKRSIYISNDNMGSSLNEFLSDSFTDPSAASCNYGNFSF